MSRFVNLHRIDSLDPATDYAEIHRISMLKEFPFDWGLALQLAFYRTYAIPAISSLLDHTGHIAADPVTRAEDTGLMMAEMIEHGLDHPRSRKVLSMMNRMHSHWTITNDDFLYVLGTFIFGPIRWVERYGWRKPTAHERAGAYGFYREVGCRMNIADIPADYAAYEAWFDAYERDNFAYTPANRRLFDASQELLVDRFPSWAAPLARGVGTALLDEPLRRALGVDRASWALRVAVRGGFRLRARIVRWMSARTETAFTPGGGMKSHPNGYELDDLGPRSLSREHN
jgi:hypothetical protein